MLITLKIKGKNNKKKREILHPLESLREVGGGHLDHNDGRDPPQGRVLKILSRFSRETHLRIVAMMTGC